MKPTQRPSATPLVSIVIPVYNKCDLTMQCLATLAQVTAHLAHEVIVVDNASTDDTPRRLAQAADPVRYVRNESNRNFAGACNQGAELARGKFLVFLNNDTVPLEGWLDALLEEVRLHPQVVAVGSRLLYENRLVQHAGVAFARESRSPFHPHRGLRADDPRVNRRRELQAVTAACVLIRPSWFKECGGFDEGYRNGYEDLELCLRLRQRGGLIVYQPRSVLFHLESQTPGRMRHDDENRSRFFERWSETLLADEDAFYFDDGYRLAAHREHRPETPRLVRFANDEERRRWSIVAQTQRAAAAGRADEVQRLLAAPETWPADAGIRRWAGILSHRAGLEDAARLHFAASLQQADDPALRVQLALQSSPTSAGTALIPAAWEGTLRAGLRALHAGDRDAARTAFNTALARGASPTLVLPSLWQALRPEGGPEAELVRRALLALPRVDPSTDAALRASTLAAPSTTFPPAAPASRPALPTASVATDAEAPPLSPTPTPAPSPTLVSILILVLNQLDHTRRCLESIGECTPEPHEIIVVDNGSTDGTAAWLDSYANDKPHVRIIRNATNQGFAAGNNQALALARGEFVLLLNNDTLVTHGWLREMLGICAQHPRTGIVGPRSNRVAGPQLVENPGYRTPADLPVFASDWTRRHAGQSRPIARVIGFCLLARKAVIDRIGGLDDRFGTGNFEDDDFCIRARLAGFEARIADGSFVHHVGSQTFQGAGINYRQAMLTNWSLFKAKWGLPADAPLEKGYRMPAQPPSQVDLRFPLPDLTLTHETSSSTQQFWLDRTLPSLEPTPPATSTATSTITSTTGASVCVDATGSSASASPTPVSPPPSQTVTTRVGLSGAEAVPPAANGAVQVAAVTPAVPRKPRAVTLPPCALAGHLGPAREHFQNRRFRETWVETLAALAVRPFHPEGFLLLAETALAVGQPSLAQQLAAHARNLTQEWKPVRKFLKNLRNGAKPNRPDWLVVPEGLLTPTRTPRLTVCLIVANEEKFIEGCLRSIRDLADQIVVVDTGSTDRTIEIARSLGAEIHHFKWCDDFSAARNAALQHATGDWILSLDADEVLPTEEHAKLKAEISKPGVLGYRLPLVNVGQESEGVSYVPRLYRNAPGLFYVSRVHEQVFSSILVRAEEWGLATALGTAQLRHFGYTKELVRERRKVERNLRLLQQAVDEIPNDCSLLMNLGLELIRSGEFAAGLRRYDEAFAALSAQPASQQTPELRESFLTQYASHLMRAKRHSDVVSVLQSPLAHLGPLTASLHFALGLAWMRTEHFAEAANAFRDCLAARGRPALSPVNPEILRAGPRHCLGNCLARLGRIDEAREVMLAALQDEPGSRAVRLDLARLHGASRQPIEALTLLTQLVADQPDDLESWRLGSELALSRPEFLEFALDWTSEAVKLAPPDALLAGQRATALLLSGDADAALPFWKSAAATGAPTALAALTLCEVLGNHPHSLASSAHEPVVSREFLGWYRRLIEVNAGALVLQLNARLASIASILPTAAQSLSSAMAEAA